MGTRETDEVRETVRKRYGQIAVTGGGAQAAAGLCCAPKEKTSCCGTEATGEAPCCGTPPADDPFIFPFFPGISSCITGIIRMPTALYLCGCPGNWVLSPVPIRNNIKKDCL